MSNSNKSSFSKVKYCTRECGCEDDVMDDCCPFGNINADDDALSCSATDYAEIPQQFVKAAWKSGRGYDYRLLPVLPPSWCPLRRGKIEVELLDGKKA